MTTRADVWVTATVEALTPLADRAAAEPMARYMKDVAPFLGIPTPERRRAQRTAWRSLPPLEPDELAEASLRLWALPQREFHYAASELIGQRDHHLPASFLLDPVERLITTTSWWDSVDSLGTHAVIPLVSRHVELVDVMWRWLRSDDRWLVRTAVQHQRGLKQATDFARLYAMCDEVATAREFFIAKAVGWALRESCRWDPDGVRAFVDAHPDLSAVARREAVRGLAAAH